MKDEKNKSVRSRVVVVLVVLLGLAATFLVFVAVRNVAARGGSDGTATVRVADGESEDELYIGSSTITKQTSGFFSSKSEYTLASANVSDSQKVTFNSCKLAGIYAPEKCTANNGLTYWITLTEIK